MVWLNTFLPHIPFLFLNHILLTYLSNSNRSIHHSNGRPIILHRTVQQYQVQVKSKPPAPSTPIRDQESLIICYSYMSVMGNLLNNDFSIVTNYFFSCDFLFLPENNWHGNASPNGSRFFERNLLF